MIITSPSNAHIKSIRRLHSHQERKRTGLFLVEGIRQVVEAARSGVAIETLIVTSEALRRPIVDQLVAEQRAAGVQCLVVTANVFAALSLRENPAGIACVGYQAYRSLRDIRCQGGVGWIALVEPQYPGNVGTILRTSDAAGCDGVILIGNAVDPYHPVALRAAMGATFTQRLVRCSFEAFQDWAGSLGHPVVATSDAALLDYTAASYRLPFVLLMGSERQGLSASQQAAADVVVRIPMAGRCDSLNLAVATALVLFEARNQYRLSHV